MANFPSISPSSIAFELGGMNVSEAAAAAVGGVCFRHSLKVNNLVCSANFENILSSQVQAIRDHYFAQGGPSLPFDVDDSSFWGSIFVVPTDSTYRYNSPPEEEHFGVYNNVTVSLLIALGAGALAGSFILVGEPAQLGSLVAFSSYAFSGTAPFILNADDADPAGATSLILNSGGAGS